MKIVEVTIAIFMVLSFLLVLSQQQKGNQTADNPQALQAVLERLASDQVIRQRIMEAPMDDAAAVTNVNDYLSNIIKPDFDRQGYSYSIQLCKVADLCINPAIGINSNKVTSYDYIIGGNSQSFSPRKLHLSIWRG